MEALGVFQVPGGSAAPASSGDGGSFAPVQNEPETTSGETLLVSAYAVVWVALMVFVVAAWRRTRSLEQKVSTLESAVAKAQAIAQTPSTKRSPPEE